MGPTFILPWRKLILATLILLLIFILTSSADASLPSQATTEELPENEQIIKTLPIFPKKLSPPIFYTTFFPIIFEYQLPQWKEADLRIKWPSGHSTNCNSSETVGFWNQVGCPSVYHYNSVIGKFFDKTGQMAFGNVNNQDALNGFPTLPISCEEISSHFVGNSDSPSTWDHYWKLLSSCPVRDFHKESVSTKLAKIDLTKLDNILRRFYDLYVINTYNHYSWSGGSVYTSSYSALQASGLLEHFVEMQRWSDSLSLCHAGKLPRHLVDFSKLKEILNVVNAKIAKGKSYTASATDLTSYYKLPLTDCTRVAKNDSLVVRTLVPIRPLKSNLSLIELQPVPFTQNFNAFSSTNLVCGMNAIRGVYEVDPGSGYIKESECKSGQLCFVKESVHHWVDPCLSSILNINTNYGSGGSNPGALASCLGKTTCQSIPTSKFPLFSRLSSNILAIVGYSADNIEIFVSCNGNPYKVIKPNETGVLLVQLSCACKVVHKFEEFHAQEPCNSMMKIQHANFSNIMTIDQHESMSKGIEFEHNGEGASGQIKTAKSNQISEKEENVMDYNWMLYLAIVLGLFGFTSFIWNIIDSVVVRKRGGHLTARSAGNGGDTSSDHFAAMAYRANRQGSGLNENPMAYLVQKEQNML